MIPQAKAVLKSVFGYDAFRPLQEEIITHVLAKKDALVVMPTGGGKSLCYQLPALIFPGLTIVVSPLISLMKDQVDQLRECGVPAIFLNSSLTVDEYRRHVELLKTHAARLLYLAPEALMNRRTLSLLSSLPVDCVAIDEAHCISEWGHDFRPEYRQLVDARATFPHAVYMALTATATPRVREDIKRSLHIDAAHEFIGSFNRPNLFIEVAPKTAPLRRTIDILNQYPGEAGIIYCLSRQQTDDLYEILHSKGYAVRPYHAGLTEKERTQNQELFIRDDIQIIVATIAFGMGINKSNVRFVVHYDLPKSLDSYYQEIGRAGRDGLQAHCLLLFNYGDIQKARYFLQQKNEHEQMVANILFNALLGFAETDICRRIPLLNYFGETGAPENCGMCDNCRMEKEDLADITIPTQMFLSCVKRTGELFGAGHVIDVLRGSRSQKILQCEHDQLSTYGIGAMHSARQWRHMSRQFIQKGLIVQELEHGSLKLTPKAWDVFRGKEKVMGRLEEASAGLKQREEGLRYDPALFNLLRKKRKEIADHANLPPFAIFHDRTLREMAAYFPQTKESLSRIYGLGAAKLEKYGAVFLEIIRPYSRIHPLPEQPPPSAQPPLPAAVSLPGNRKHRRLLIGEAYQQGRTVEQLAVDFGIKPGTALEHLYQYWQDGHPLARDEFRKLSRLAESQKQTVLTTFDHLGTERLRPIFDALNGEIAYDEIKLLRLSYLCGRRAQPLEYKTFVCLATSRKYGGYCVAGKEWSGEDSGPWIRPVGEEASGELSLEDIRLNNGNIPQLLDIIHLPVIGSAPHAYQKENIRTVKNHEWNWKGKLPATTLAKLCDDVALLWMNGHHSANGLNDRIPEEMAHKDIDTSLYLIRPDDFRLVVADDVDGRKKVRAGFEFKGVSYILSLTDTDIERNYLKRDAGEYPLTARELYLTISLGEPFHGYCYKLVAGVMACKEQCR